MRAFSPTPGCDGIIGVHLPDRSTAQAGVKASAVTGEVYIANGLPSLTLVDLPKIAFKESKDRVRNAILNPALQSHHSQFCAR